MALLNRFSRLNDRGETGIFTFIVTKSVTRDFHRDATTKDFCFGYHRWAISFQRPSEKVLGVHLLLRNPSPNTACVVDFTLTFLNRQHFSQNESYTKKQAKFTITNPMQGVARWIQMSDLVQRNFSSETGEFLFELALSNMSTIFECDIQLNAPTLGQYKSMLKNGTPPASGGYRASSATPTETPAQAKPSSKFKGANPASDLINLETNYFTFGAFDWSLTIVPLVLTPSSGSSALAPTTSSGSSGSLSASGNSQLLTPNRQHSGSSASISSNHAGKQHQLEPVCRVYLNRLSGFDSLCRVKYRVILGHHQQHANLEHADSRLLDQISDSSGRIRGYQFRNTNILKLISLRSGQQQGALAPPLASSNSVHQQHQASTGAALDLRVHIEMYCANTVSEARVPIHRKPNETQAWCVEADTDSADSVRLKLFFMDLQSVPRNHIRYISWIAYIVRRLPGSAASLASNSALGSPRESIVVKNAPHSNYYLQDGMDMGTIMDTELSVKELNESGQVYLDNNQLTVHIEWVDSLLLFSHLYSNYDSLATIHRHQISRELSALQDEFAHLESKYARLRRNLNQVTSGAGRASSASGQTQPNAPTGLLRGAGDYLSTGSSSDSLPDMVSSSLKARETNVLAADSRLAANDKDELSQVHFVTRAAARLKPQQTSSLNTSGQSVSPPSDSIESDINLVSANQLPSKPSPIPSRLQRWPAYCDTADPQPTTSRRQLPTQPAMNLQTNQSYPQVVSYGQLGPAPMDSNSYLMHARPCYELGARPVCPDLMNRPYSQNMTEDETGNLDDIIRSAYAYEETPVYDHHYQADLYPLTARLSSSPQNPIDLEQLSLGSRVQPGPEAEHMPLLNSTNSRLCHPTELVQREVFQGAPEVGRLNQLPNSERLRYK